MSADTRRPAFNRPTDGRSQDPLLAKMVEEDKEDVEPERGRRSMSNRHATYAEDIRGRLSEDDEAEPLHRSQHFDPSTVQRPTFSRRSTMRSRSPREVAAENAAKKKYTYAAFFLVLCLISFCIQTELSAYIQHDLGWDKAYCMMYLTHGSWVTLWVVQLGILKLQKRDMPWGVFMKKHLHQLKTTAQMVESGTLDIYRPAIQQATRPIQYMIRFTVIITSALTIAGLSWYIAVSLTTPSDLTAIYNCSAFFAYVFSVPILKEPLRLDKSIAVVIAIVGVLVVAYGDSKLAGGGEDTGAASRFIGNLVIGVGSVLYGLYEVLYKRYACPPEGVSPGRGVVFANTFGALIGVFTLTVLWIPIPLLHWTGLEVFELPDASTGWLILLAVLMNATFSGSFLVLISLTSPVLSSVAALLTIFIVAVVDWFITGEPLSWAAIVGGSMIIVAFVGLSLSTYREMQEHEAQKMAVDFSDSDLESTVDEN